MQVGNSMLMKMIVLVRPRIHFHNPHLSNRFGSIGSGIGLDYHQPYPILSYPLSVVYSSLRVVNVR
jgi:hypothetical protein